MTVQPVRLRPSARLWKVAQLIGLFLTIVLLVALLTAPDPSLGILWNAVIPLLPAVFLVQPGIWRNVCPLATLNVLAGKARGGRKIGPVAARRFGAAGIVLLIAMVPARRFLFNTDGTVLAVTIVAVALLALGLGLVYDMKAGFCNALCPVLPVERLYGQRPLLRVSNAHCTPCTVCTKRGCLDLVPKKSVEQTLGKAANSTRWLLTPYGAFAAAFPGFVIGYYTTSDGPLSAAMSVYANVGMWMALSYVAVVAATLVLRAPAAAATLPIAGAAVGLYYWFSAPVVTEALALPGWAPATIRTVGLALVALWLWRAWRTRPASRMTGFSRAPGAAGG